MAARAPRIATVWGAGARGIAPAMLALLLIESGCSRSTATAGGGSMAAAAPVMPAGVTPQAIAQGDSIFAAISCKNCHGMAGVGGANGPSLLEGAWLHGKGTYPEIVQLVATGVPRASIKGPGRTRAMNPRGGPARLNDAQIASVAAYVWSISRKKT